MKSVKMRLLCALLPALLATGCTSTDVVSPSDPEKKSDVITLSVSAPEAYAFPSTRAAHEGHQLRYVAKLYKGKTTGSINVDNFVARKEMLASAGSLIQFEAPEKGDYTVAIFADYIPSDAEKNDNGSYGNKYYKIDGNNDYIDILEHGDNTLPPYSVNNDNYDCFVKVLRITKGDDAYEENVVLRRAVAKVIVQANDGGRPDGVTKITLTKLSFMTQYSLDNGIAGANANKTNISVDLTFDNSGTELFYFYTFPAKKGSYYIQGQGLNEITFMIGAKDDSYVYNGCSISPSLFYPEANYIYRVKGDFLKPTNAPALPSDMINLTVSVSENWESPDVIQ